MSDWEERVNQVASEVENVLSGALNRLNDGMVLKFVIAFEYLTPDGERQLASLASPGLMKWDVSGMLGHILRNDDLDTLKQLIQGDEE